MSRVSEWFNKVVLNKHPEPVATPEPYLGPDELAEKLTEEANDLFRAVQEKRIEAARVLDAAAQEASTQAENLQRRAQEALRVAAVRAAKAAQSSKIAEKLNEFIS